MGVKHGRKAPTASNDFVQPPKGQFIDYRPKAPEVEGEVEAQKLEADFKRFLNLNQGMRRDANLLKRIRQCKHCPLRPRETVVQGVVVTSPARCAHYNKDPKFQCPIDEYDYLKRLKIYFDILQDPNFNVDNLLKALTLDRISDLMATKPFEQVAQGAPGDLTAMVHKDIKDYAKLLKGNDAPAVQVNNTTNTVDLRGAVLSLQKMKDAVESATGKKVLPSDATPIVDAVEEQDDKHEAA